MRNKKIIKQLVSFVLVLVLLVTSITLSPLFTNNVNAEGGSGATSGGNYSGGGSLSNGEPAVWGDSTGYRIYLTNASIVSEGSITSSTYYLNQNKDFAVYEISDGGNSSESPSYASQVNSGGKSLYGYNWNSDRQYASNTILLSGNTGSNTDISFSELVGDTYGSFSPWSSEGSTNFESAVNWANSTFSTDNFNNTDLINNFLSRYKDLINNSGRDSSWVPSSKSDFISGNWYVVIEPVVIFSTKGSSHCYACSYQDFYGDGSYSYMSFRSASWMSGTASQMSNFFVDYQSAKYGHVTTQGTSEVGYGVYFTELPQAKPTHAGTNIVYSYDSAIKSNISKAGTNNTYSTTIEEPNIGGVTNVASVESAVSADSRGTLTGVALGSWGSTLHNPLESSTSNDNGTVTSRLVNTSETAYNDYVTSEYQTFNFSLNAGKYGLDTLYNGVPKVSVSTTSKSVIGGDISVGQTYSVTADSGLGSVANSYAGSEELADASESYAKVTVNDSSKDTNRIVSNSAIYALANSYIEKASGTEYTASGNDNVAMSVELVVKKTYATSYLASATYTDGVLGTTSSSSTQYCVTDGGSLTANLGGNNSYIVTFEDNKAGSYALSSNPTGSNILNALAGKTYNGTSGLADLRSDLARLGIIATVTKRGEGSANIVVGSCGNSNGDLSGYDVLAITQNNTPSDTATSMHVADYELNYLYPTLLGDTENSKFTGVNSGYTGVSPLVYNNVTYYKGYVSDNAVSISKNNTYAGNMISKNNTLGAYKNIFYYSPTGLFNTEATNPKSFDNESAPSVVLTHATSLTRGSFGDSMVVSSINSTTSGYNANNYLTDNLGLTIGNTGSVSTVASSTATNSSSTIMATKTDLFSWSADRGRTYLVPKTIKTDSTVQVPNTVVDQTTGAKSTSYVNKTVSSYETVYAQFSDTVFTNGFTTASYKVTEDCYKYVALDRTSGMNVNKTVSLETASDGINGDSNDAFTNYKSASVGISDKVLKFYPEIGYRAYISSATDTINSAFMSASSASQVSAVTVWMMGEKARSVKPSSLYILTTSGNGTDNNVTGKSDSDTTATGTAAKTLSTEMNNLQVVYAGGNVNMSAVSSVGINMTGFALDQLDKSLDSTITSVNGSSYQNVIADDSDIKSAWGSDTSYSALTDFTSWVNDISSGISVDATLKTTQKTGATVTSWSGFNTTVGKTDGGVISTGTVFNIQFKGGTVTDDAAYQALITEIACKYFNTTSPSADQYNSAKDIFASSDICKSILDAIEDSQDADNNAQATNFSGGSKWYDETVRTFVVRQFTTTPITVANILVSDKVDITAGPSQSVTSAAANFSNGYYGKWYLTLYLSKNPSNSLSNAVFYNPDSASKTNPSGNLAVASSSGTVLLNRIYIKGADFIISDATTADMKK